MQVGQLAAEHAVFDSVEDMLSPPSLSQMLGTPIKVVSVAAMESNGFSSNELFYVHAGEQRYVLKRLNGQDWMACASRDEKCRSMAVWRTGLLDRLEPELRHGMIAGSKDGENHALLMRDCSAGLGGWSGPGASRRLDRALEALAFMHARFWNDQTLADVVYELADVEVLLSVCWPRSWSLIKHHPETVGLLQRGWQALLDLVDADVRRIIEQILADPAPLVSALESKPTTLLHGDYRPDNVAITEDSVIAFDWQLTARGPGVLDLAWLINGGDTFASRSWAFDRYRDYLAQALNGQFDATGWERSLAVGTLAEVLRKGNWHALFAVDGDDDRKAHFRQFIPAYNTFVREGAAHL